MDETSDDRLTIEELPSTSSVVTLAARGEIDLTTAENVVEAIPVDGHAVVLDLSGVDFMDSSGLRALVVGSQRACRDGVRLVLSSPRGQVARLLEMTAIHSVLEICSTREQALAALAKRDRG